MPFSTLANVTMSSMKRDRDEIEFECVCVCEREREREREREKAKEVKVFAIERQIWPKQNFSLNKFDCQSQFLKFLYYKMKLLDGSVTRRG